jgi:anaerobic magnesium-protoporphyrin IX monomethyl ester cyclase
MRVLFISKGERTLAIEYLSAVLKANGHEAVALNNPGYVATVDILTKTIAAIKPGLVACSVDSLNSAWYFRFAERLKQTPYPLPVVFGGIHVTTTPAAVLASPAVDYIGVGEGEYALLDLVEALEAGERTDNIRGIWTKRNGRIIDNGVRPLIQDLDELPRPDKDVYLGNYYSEDQHPSPKVSYYMMTSRGCPYVCSYCHHSYTHDLFSGKSRKTRFRNIDDVIAELKDAVRKYNIRNVIFWDDNMTVARERFVELIERYREEINLPYYCTTHPNLINEPIAEALGSVRGTRVALGLQTINPKIRKDVCHRVDTQPQLEKATRLFREHRVSYTVDIIFGLPESTAKDYVETVEFFDEVADADVIRAFTLFYLPKLPVTEYANSKGLLDEKDRASLDEHGFAVAKVDPDVYRLRNYYMLRFMLPKKVRAFIHEHELYRWFAGPVKAYQTVKMLDVPEPYFVKQADDSLQSTVLEWMSKRRVNVEQLCRKVWARARRAPQAMRLQPLPALDAARPRQGNRLRPPDLVNAPSETPSSKELVTLVRRVPVSQDQAPVSQQA